MRKDALIGGIALLAAAGVGAFIAARTYKQVKDLDLDDIFEDMNEAFFPGLTPEKNEK